MPNVFAALTARPVSINLENWADAESVSFGRVIQHRDGRRVFWPSDVGGTVGGAGVYLWVCPLGAAAGAILHRCDLIAISEDDAEADTAAARSGIDLVTPPRLGSR